MFRLRGVVRTAFALVGIAAVLFGSALRIDLPFFWAYLAVTGAFALAVVLTVSENLLRERIRPAERGIDNLKLLRIGAGVIFALEWIIAGVDVGQLHFSDTVPEALQLVALVLYASVFAVWWWAMQVNPFFSAASRIQRDRGHHLVESGPYRFVRHPGYASFSLFGWGGPIALGSWCAALPHLAVVVVFLRRAAIEDRMLRKELDGYEEYASRTRYRVLPGIW